MEENAYYDLVNWDEHNVLAMGNECAKGWEDTGSHGPMHKVNLFDHPNPQFGGLNQEAESPMLKGRTSDDQPAFDRGFGLEVSRGDLASGGSKGS